jgi:hypothetical protein
MADHTVATLRVRVVARDEDIFRSDEPRARFWRAITHATQNNTETAPHLFERRLEENFGDNLKRRIVSYFHTSWRGDHHRQDFPGRVVTLEKADQQGLALSHVFFEAHVRGYGSLDLAVEIAGARDLAALLDNNLDLFMMLMRAYIPDSFREVTNVHGNEDVATFDISPSPELREAFEERPRRALALPQAMRSREFAIWALTNGTLLPAVLLALLVCYVTYKGVAEERTIAAATQQRVLAHQEALLKQSNDRAQRLAAVEDKLLERALAALPPAQPGHTSTTGPPPAPQP